MSRLNLYLVLVLVLVVLFLYANSGTKSGAKTAEPKSSQTIRTSENFHFNLPKIYFERTPVNNKKRYVQKCGRFPDIFTIKFSNDYWQVQKTSNGTFHLLNAFLDDRKFELFSWRKHYVRIVGMLNRVNPGRYFCQFWYSKEKEPFLVKSEKLVWIWDENWERLDGFYQPYLISCVLPDGRIPMSVSLVEKTCERATNNLRVFYEKGNGKKDFVVCVKGLSFPYDRSARLAEWIELVTILGADKVHFYKFHVHPNIEQVLQYYHQQNKIEITPLTLVGEVSNRPYFQHKYLQKQTIERRLQEVIPYNDCFYRYISQYKYVVFLDIDEVIVPTNNSWFELMETLQRNQSKKSSYLAKHVDFFDNLEIQSHKNIPNYMHMLRHINRKKYPNPTDYVKGFFDTDKVVAVYNNKTSNCKDWEKCENDSLEIEVSLAQLQHYGDDCVNTTTDDEGIEESVEDLRLWYLKDVLIGRVTKTLKDLDFLKKDMT